MHVDENEVPDISNWPNWGAELKSDVGWQGFITNSSTKQEIEFDIDHMEIDFEGIVSGEGDDQDKGSYRVKGKVDKKIGMVKFEINYTDYGGKLFFMGKFNGNTLKGMHSSSEKDLDMSN